MYVKEALGAVANYKWGTDGKCYNTQTGVAYSGDQKLSNCQALLGNAPAPQRSGWSGAWDFISGQLAPAHQAITGPKAAPTYSTSSLVVPAVAIVGGVALLLILKKKK